MAIFYNRRLIKKHPDESTIDFCKTECVDSSDSESFCSPRCTSLCSNICEPYSFPPPPPTYAVSPANHSKTFLLLTTSLAVLATAFLCFSLYAAYKFFKSRRNRRSERMNREEDDRVDFFDEERGPEVDHPIWYIRTVGLQQSVIQAITICRFKKGEGLIEGTECSVCLNEFQEDESLRLLPKCSHAFHLPCIDTWLRSHTNCPLCRAPIVAPCSGGSSTNHPHQNPGLVEETGEILENNTAGNGDDIIEEAGQRQVEEGQRQMEDENGVKTGQDHVHDDNDFQPMRRSVSMDVLPASLISALPNKLDVGSGRKCNFRLVGSFVVGRSKKDQEGSSSMKRSHSCSANVFLSRYSRSMSSVFPS